MKISLITVCYNSDKTIEDTIKSVLMQKYQNYEFIIIDGKSSDNTINIIKKYEKEFNGKLKYISEKDFGLYDAMNKGIKMSNGDVIGILNSDDVLYANNTFDIINNSFKNNVDFIYGNVLYCNENFSKIVRNYKTGPIKNDYMCIAHPSIYLKKNVIDDVGMYDLKYKVSADYDFIIRLYKSKFKGKYINEYFVMMRLGGISNGIKGYLSNFSDSFLILKNNKINFPFIKTLKRSFETLMQHICSKFNNRHYDLLLYKSDYSYIKNNKNSLISIIIPVYNSEKYISKCIDSVLKQTYQNFELIIVDDGSKDNSLNIINKYKNDYPNKIIVHSQKNGGVASARNKGLDLSTGEYIVFIDNDDFIDADYLEILYKNALLNDCDIVYSGYRRVNSKNEILDSVFLDNAEWSKYKIITVWSKIFKKSFIIENKLKLLKNNIGEDVYMMLQANQLAKKTKIINYIGYNWFYNDTSVSNTIHKNMDYDIKLDYLLNITLSSLKEKKCDLDDKFLEYFVIKQIIWYLLYSSKGASKDKIYSECDKYFKWLKYNFPFYLKNPYIKFYKLKGEKLNVRLIIWIYIILYKFHLSKYANYIYSKL